MEGSITRHTWTFEGIDVHYDKTGSGPPLLILHGWGSSAQVMLPVAKSLSDRYTCYVPDLPGFGRTQPPDQPWSVDDYTRLTKEFLAYLGGKTDLLVHSFGGRILLKLLSSEDHCMAGRVLITGGAGLKPRRTWRYYVRLYTAKTLKAPFQLLPGKLKEKGLAWLRNSRVWKMLGSSDYQQLDGVMRQTFINVVNEHLDDCLPHIQKEVLLLWGEEDAAAPLDQARRMEQGIEGAALVTIENAGHYAFLDQPAKFNSIARAFLLGD